jgi:hypothetical protein
MDMWVKAKRERGKVWKISYKETSNQQGSIGQARKDIWIRKGTCFIN